MTTGFLPNANLHAYLRAVESLLRNNDMTEALRLSHQAVAAGFEHPRLLAFAAYHELQTGSPQLALDTAMRARDLSPRNADILNAVGNCLSHLGRFADAVKAFDSALREAPDAYLVRYNKATAMESLQELSRARTEYQRVVDAQPSHVEALARLAHLALQRGDAGTARNHAARALQVDPAHVSAGLDLAAADIADRQFHLALTRLREILLRKTLTVVQRSTAQGLEGDAYDGLNQTSEAFHAYSQSQATRRVAYRTQFDNQSTESAAAVVARFTAYFRAAPQERWCASPDDAAADPVGTQVFLVGFPRSGTTLLEQILAGHPDIEVMSERSCLVDAQESFAIPPDGLARLSSLSGSELESFREKYWSRVHEEGMGLRRAVFVDKMPFYCVFLCLVARLFPRAKIVFAQRDPRDVVFSCFRRRFAMTEQLYELTTLQSTADHFAAVMALCELYRERLGLAFCDVRHENVVADMEAETRRLCGFLGITWNAAMMRVAETASRRSINTPSGPQLARGLSSKGIGQWQRYRDHLTPILPTLAPWVARFGYPER
jgi:tetratricopeptide (TPR) repeat protein